MTGKPRDDQRRRGGEQGARAGKQLGNRTLRALGPVDPERERRCEHEEREA